MKCTKDDKVDKQELLKTLDNAVSELHWKTVVSSAAETHCNQVSANKTEILKVFELEPFNIKTEQCNPIFYFLFESIWFDMFAVSAFDLINLQLFTILISQNCPKEALIENDGCAAAKDWMSRKSTFEVLKHISDLG